MTKHLRYVVRFKPTGHYVGRRVLSYRTGSAPGDVKTLATARIFTRKCDAEGAAINANFEVVPVVVHLQGDNG